MGQYFENNENLASKEKNIYFEINDLKISLITDNGVFSKSKLDEGSFVFLKTILPLSISGKILDLGCGYGPIGLTLAMSNPNCEVTLADVNLRALELAKKNAINLKVNHRITVIESDIYSNIEDKFDYVLINPPIRAGKKVTYAFYKGSYEHLQIGGSMFIVIRKAQGAISAAKYIESLFGNISLINRKKGYYVYQAIKR